MRLLPQPWRIWFQAFTCVAVSTEHRWYSWLRPAEHTLPRWFLLQNLLEVICLLHDGKTWIRTWEKQCKGSRGKWRSWRRTPPSFMSLLLTADAASGLPGSHSAFPPTNGIGLCSDATPSSLDLLPYPRGGGSTQPLLQMAATSCGRPQQESPLG